MKSFNNYFVNAASKKAWLGSRHHNVCRDLEGKENIWKHGFIFSYRIPESGR